MAAVAAARPTVSVYSYEDAEKVTKTLPLPDVFTSPIRPDLINFVHTQIRKNSRQAYAVKYEAGMQTAAESWGTGRAVSRIPRVPGGGTHRAGQGAFGNMCRGGRMFAPTKTWRRWHRKIATGQKRYAVSSALAASAVPALVMARGHLVNDMPELPLVLGDGVESLQKTKQAVQTLERFGLGDELEKVKDSKKIRPGKGKMRNRRYVMKKGPLIVHAEDSKRASLILAFRNIPGLQLAHVDRLNLLDLAPGGHVGRLVIWTEAAFERLNEVFGTREKRSEMKSGFVLPRPLIMNADLGRLINSDEVQKVVRPAKETEKAFPRKVNPLRNKKVMQKLNPYYNTHRRRAIAFIQNEKLRKEQREAKIKEKRAERKKSERRAFYKKMAE